MLPRDGEWTEVRWRKLNSNRVEIEGETSYFVTNIPYGVTKPEFWKIFSRFGGLSDVYFGGNKGANGKYFGFNRFLGVEDTKDLESSLNGTKCRNNTLEINIAKHDRKIPVRIQQVKKVKVGGSRLAGNGRVAGNGQVDNRSYAHVAAGLSTKPGGDNTHSIQHPICLKSDQNMIRWIKDYCLIGEAKTLHHLAHMPALISIHSEHRPSVKYVGGMLALISFDTYVNARRFLEGENNWKDIFKWLKWGDTVEEKFERVASVRIVGLPLQLWNEENYIAILAKFGKLVVPFDNIQERMDL
ncbi:hypothetical protein L2E82_03598 [Cichorium intybus]|uniref:Uncharacterized protein n=1 Tax=Cichorium intybus TaxID=13427 RepID=A0ACB9H433_CICIN|nr:hypothetical protein L2E82_03598 [Cichorium intybus]